MANVGMGAVYEKTHDDCPLRCLHPEEREELPRRYYNPHHLRLVDLAAEILMQFGYCLIIDVHSFASHPLLNESDQSTDRPDICIGTDAFHTPRAIVDIVMGFFAKFGLTAVEISPLPVVLSPEILPIGCQS